MPFSAFTPPPQPQLSNTTSNGPQNEAQGPIKGAGSITTLLFLLVVLSIGWMTFNLLSEADDTDDDPVEYVVEDDLNWEQGETP